MKHFLIRRSVFFALMLMSFSFSSSAFAQQSVPENMAFLCSDVNTSTKTTICYLQVPADTIGSELDISIPNEQITNLTNIQRGEDLSSSSAFFKLEAQPQGNEYFLQADFADFNAETFSSTAYGMFSFRLTLKSVDSSLFPLTIPSQLKLGSKLFTRAALEQNEASLNATTDLALPIVLNLGDENTDTTAPEITSSFSFEGNENGGGNTFKPSPVTYCFDDPISSMTDQEWAIVCEAKRRGIVSGNPRPEGVFFYPNQAINRAEAVKIVTLGILRSLGFLNDSQFAAEEQRIRAAASDNEFITYPDIRYETNGEPPWFAVYVNVATEQEIVGGYPHDGTYKAINKINNAESYRVIVETGRVASNDIAAKLEENELQYRLTKDWFMKYADTLSDYGVERSDEYAKFTLRKEFLIYVMELLYAVGL